MAIYHLEAKMVSRGAGRSAVAAAAYLSCSRLLNEYDGVQHDYTRKQGLVWQQIFLPTAAPAPAAAARNAKGMRLRFFMSLVPPDAALTIYGTAPGIYYTIILPF